MSTPGKAKALRALGAAKRRNRQRIQAGKKPIIGGRKVSPGKFKATTGESVSKVKKGSKPGKSQRQSKQAIVSKWGKSAVSKGKKK